MDEKAFLTKVAQRLGHSRPRTAAAWDAAPSLPRPYGAMDLTWACDRFLTELTAVGGIGLRLPDPRAAAERVAAVAGAASARYGSKLVLLSAEPDVAALDLPAALAAVGLETVTWDGEADPDALKHLAERSCLGVTGAEAAVAETGSLLLSASPQRGRLISLLPPVHIAVVPVAKVLPSVAEAFRMLALRGEMPSQAVFVTGPSKSADIEFDLSIGVHGPCEAHTILIG